jgi:hypothetical protein
LEKDLNTLTSPQKASYAKNSAIKHVISTFFPSLRPTSKKLNLHFGQEVSAVDIPCLWKIHRDASSGSVPALPGEEDAPVLASVGKITARQTLCRGFGAWQQPQG